MAVMRIHKTKDYTVMSNTHLREREMSLKAKGLLSLMFSLSDNWNYSVAGLMAMCKENETAINSTLKELKLFGYLSVTKLMPNQTESGRIEYVYDIYETPIARENLPIEKQGVENLGVENLGVENPLQLNNNILNTNYKENNINKEKKSIKRKETEVVFSEKIFEHWNSKKIIIHQKITQQHIDLIAKAIRTYGYDEVLYAIDRYSNALQDETYKNCKYKWSLSQFLKQSNALPDFLDEGSKWLNYKEYLDRKQPQTSQKYANPFKTIDGTQYGATDEELSFYDKYCKI